MRDHRRSVLLVAEEALLRKRCLDGIFCAAE
jgi:hypothetical protein